MVTSILLEDLVIPAESTSRVLPWLAAAATFLLLAALTHGRVFRAGNDASRWAQIEAIVDLGERPIDRSQFAWTIDRVTLDGHSYSNKPPLLSLVGATVYAVVRGATGGRLAEPAARPRLVYLVTLLLVGGSAAWLVAELARALELHTGLDPPRRRLILAAATCGTLVTSFATTLTNHTVAAALLFAAWHAVWRGRGGRAGLWGGLAACVDVVPGAGMLPFLALALRPSGSAALRRFALAVVGCALLGVAADLAVIGHPLPPKLVPGAVDASTPAGLSSVAGVLLPQGWSYPLAALFGGRGFFSLSPVLLFGAAGLVALARRRESDEGRVAPAITPASARLLGIAIAVQIAFHVLFAGSFGGWSYGFRYLIPVAPLLLFCAPAAMGGRWRVAFAAALVPSVVVALLGAYNPWPPVFEQESERHPVAALVRNPVGGNAAAFLEEHLPGSFVAERAGRAWISEDPTLRRRWLAYFFWSKDDEEMLGRFAP